MADVPAPRSLEPIQSGRTADVTWERLEDQISWYDRKSRAAQHSYKRVKVIELVVAASVPPLAALEVSTAVVSIVASLVVVIEGLQHLFQWNEHWIAYRSTCEALKHERYLYLAHAGPYTAASDPRALLAERVEGLVSQEHAKWTSSRQESSRGTDTPAR